MASWLAAPCTHPRRAVAAVLLAVLFASAGCASTLGLGNDCRLHHTVSEDPSPGVASIPEYEYANLSADARTVFDRTLEENGSFVTGDHALDSPEFRYTDEVGVYNVSRDGEIVRFRTRSGHGCTIEDH